MSNNTIVIVGLKGKEFKNYVTDESGEANPPDTIHLSYASLGYESGDVWGYNLKSFKTFSHPISKDSVEDSGKGGIFGIYVAGTWSGAIDLESIQEYIDEAKRIFKERTDQEGKVYVIGEQV